MRLAAIFAAAVFAMVPTAGGTGRAADLNNAALTYSPGSCQTYLNTRWENKSTTLFKGCASLQARSLRS